MANNQIRGNTQIMDATIENAQIAAAAAIATTKLADGAEFLQRDGSVALTGDLNAGSNKIGSLADGTLTGDAINLGQLNTAIAGLSGALVYRGVIDASGTPDLSGSSTGNTYIDNATAYEQGDFFVISVAGNLSDGTNTLAVDVGDMIYINKAVNPKSGLDLTTDVDKVDNTEASDILRTSDISTDQDFAGVDPTKLTTRGAIETFVANEIAAIPGGATLVDGEIPTGLINSSNTTYTLANTPSPATSLKVYLNGVRQRLTTDYTLATATITMTEAPTTGDNILVDYTY